MKGLYWCMHATTMRYTSWVISNMATTEICPVHVSAILKEYEILTLIYNGKPFRLDLCFGVCKDRVLLAICWGSTKFEGKMSKYKLIQKHSCPSSPATRTADLSFFDDLLLQIIKSISPKASVENSSAQWANFYKWTEQNVYFLWPENIQYRLFFPV